MTGSTIQLKEPIPLTSDIATDSEEELCAGDSGSDYDDVQDLLREINSTALDHAKGNYFPETVGDQGSYRTDSSWGPTTYHGAASAWRTSRALSSILGLAGLLQTRLAVGRAAASPWACWASSRRRHSSSLHLNRTVRHREEPGYAASRPFCFCLHGGSDRSYGRARSGGALGSTHLTTSRHRELQQQIPLRCRPEVNIDADVDEEVDEDPPTRAVRSTNKGGHHDHGGHRRTDVKKKDTPSSSLPRAVRTARSSGTTTVTGTVTTGMRMTFGMVPEIESELACPPQATCRHARRCFELGTSCSLGSRQEAELSGRTDGRSIVGPFPFGG